MWKTQMILHKTVDKLNISENLNIYMWISRAGYKMSLSVCNKHIMKGYWDTKKLELL